MLWRGGRRSDNVEDRRGGGGFAGGGFGGGGLGGGGFGRGGFGGRTLGGGIGLIVVVVVALFFGVDPTTLLQSLGGDDTGAYQQPYDDQDNAAAAPASSQTGAGDDDMKQFVSVVLADTEDTWTELFKNMGKTYQDPHLVLFSGRVRSACGLAQSAMGPFYCPGDSKVYIDLSFYDELQQRFHASGDFAQAYVIAHEVGHHVQHLLGITDQVDRRENGLGETEVNALSVRVELQADCFAGVWAYHANQERKILEEGDIEEALNAASAIGDDKLEQETQGYVVPDSFTHGTSAQRVRWFKNGFRNGAIGDCDTFSAKTL